MNKPAAFRATYSDLKLIKTRQCVQVIFELPLADFDAAYTILGGMPNPASETWFGIAPLKLPPVESEVMLHPVQPAEHNAKLQSTEPDRRSAGAKRMDWRELQPAAQAGIRCADPVFWAFLHEEHCFPESPVIQNKEDAAHVIRTICNVQSRSELGTNHKARILWKQLDDQFQAWQRVGA